MIELPSELIIDIFDLACAEDAHDIVQKVHLAQVCAYWRAVALAYPTFWARIRIRTSRDAVLFPIALGRSGDTSLDVELPWQYLAADAMPTDVEHRDVVDALIEPAQRLRLKRLYIEYSRALHEFRLLSAGLDFPILDDLEFHGQYVASYAGPHLQATCLRKLVLSKVELDVWEKLIISSPLDHLYLESYVIDEEAPILTSILSRCLALRHLEWNVTYDTFTSDYTAAAKHRDAGSLRLAPHLHTLRLGQNADPDEMLSFINKHRVQIGLIHDITATIYCGAYEMQLLLPEVFQGTGSLVDLRIHDTDCNIVIRDNGGCIRRLNFWGDRFDWTVDNLWRTLAIQNAIDETLHSLRMRTVEWNGLARAFSQRPPTALAELYITISGGIEYEILDGETRGPDANSRPPRVLDIPNLHRIVFLHDSICIDSESIRVTAATRVREILLRIDCDASTRVEVCISESLRARGEAMLTPRISLDGLSDKWAFCTHRDCATV